MKGAVIALPNVTIVFPPVLLGKRVEAILFAAKSVICLLGSSIAENAPKFIEELKFAGILISRGQMCVQNCLSSIENDSSFKQIGISDILEVPKIV